MRVMSAGAGYQYLLRSVVAGEGDRSLTTPITRYYAEAGTPPGRWLGSGLAGLGNGELTIGDQVTEAQLALLIGVGRDPVTGKQLGRAYPVYTATEDRIAARAKDLDPGLSEGERAAAEARIEAEEASMTRRRPVAAYDLTFSVPKSVSTLWGVADANLQEMIVEAHHAAVADVIDYFEREIAATRTGVAAGDGAVAQVPVRGIIAAAFDHWDSRAGDPQLHTHVVISNKARAVLDGRWRSLDGRPIHAAITALSPYYDALLADRLTGVFGFEWEEVVRARNLHAHAEIAGVPDDLVNEFSGRTRDIDKATDRLITEYVATHGHRPGNAVRIRLRARATIETRPEKEIRSLADLTTGWRARASRTLSTDAAAWAGNLAASGTPAHIEATDISSELIAEVAAAVVVEVGKRRSTWRHWNLWAEASRQTMVWRFPDAESREQVVAEVVAAAEDRSISLTPPELALTPGDFRREDGTSVFRPRHATVYSSAEILAAEDHLLARADDLTAPRVRSQIVERVASHAHDGHRLSAAQAEALKTIATSGRQLDVLVGPAGAGKTTAMNALRKAWRDEHGPRTVIGLAPSAAAAAVLAADLGTPCENSAMWLTQHALGRTDFRRGQLVIIDEAALADTASLDEITAIASDAGAKVVLVGDWAQLQSVDAGGAFGMLAHARPDVPELTEIHRFAHDWEKTASLDLRAGRPDAVAVYARHDRLRDGTAEEMLEAGYAAWKHDTEKGRTSILVAESTDLVRSLNTRARADRILSDATDSTRETSLCDGTYASPGDVIITRRNDRRNRTSSGLWVRNGDLWQVKAVRRNGSLAVHAAGHRRATVVLPREYVAEHVELGYAITAHRAQGLTVDTAHVLASSRTTRENLYVALTRGRDTNTAYVALDQPDESHAAPPNDELNARTVLHGVLQHSSAELSAHETIAAEQTAVGSIAHLAAEYETLAAAAQRDRWVALIRSSGLIPDQADKVIDSDAFGPLAAAFRRIEADGRDPGSVLRAAVGRRGLVDAEDIAAVLHHRIRMATKRGNVVGRYVAGLIPAATGPLADSLDTALGERAALIESRARSLATDAARTNAPWLRDLGPMPIDPAARVRWLDPVTTIAAYRDRYQIESDRPLGAGVGSVAQRDDADRATLALRDARDVAAAHAFSASARGAPSISGP
ncbi:MobF family relaxase [Nocardioides sp. NPDC057767]|uniref:MobF family relaxase n=1 Tax=unclassified Nocardioides TaxID=2615069 RepID=UPI00366FB693